MMKALSIRLTRDLLDQVLVPVGLAPKGGVLIGAGLTKTGDLVFTFTRDDFPGVLDGAEPKFVGAGGFHALNGWVPPGQCPLCGHIPTEGSECVDRTEEK